MNLVHHKWNIAATGLLIALLSCLPGAGQELPQAANPAPGCQNTPAQSEEAKGVALRFAVLTGDAKVKLADPSYVQHNPVQHKRAKDENISDFESFKRTFQAPAAVAPGSASTQPQPPAGNRYEVVTVQCDIVTVIHKVFRQDPTAAPGNFYEAFTFDAYRVKGGKVIEHWDDAVLPPVGR